MEDDNNNNLVLTNQEKLIIAKILDNNLNNISLSLLQNKTNLGIDQLRRGIERLKYRNLVLTHESSKSFFSLDVNGIKALKEGFPERILLTAILDGHNSIQTILDKKILSNHEINIAIAQAKKRDWISFSKDKQLSVKKSVTELTDEEKILERFKLTSNIPKEEFSEKDLLVIDSLMKRPNYIKENQQKEIIINIHPEKKKKIFELDLKIKQIQLTPDIISSGKWRELSFNKIDVSAPVSFSFPGRKHPLTELINEIKEAFVSLGFTEIDGPIIQSTFWNFDVLFTPQDHAARDMQDTFYLSNMNLNKSSYPESIVRKVSNIHEKSWNYSWDIQEAEKIVLRTHTTPVTLKYLAENKPDNARIFSVGRVFRNEKVSYKHLVEFNQIEGIVTNNKVTIRDLMGIQKEFYSKLGIDKIKFWPTFFPYTEPSLQSMVYNERLEKWVELFGMGMFRPEVTKPLGIKNRVLAWGGGIERLAMLRYNLDDVRELYSNRLSWLRSTPRCL